MNHAGIFPSVTSSKTRPWPTMRGVRCGRRGTFDYNAPMKDVEGFLAGIARQIERLRSGDVGGDLLGAVYEQLAPVLRVRADQIASGRARSLEVTLAVAQGADPARPGGSSDAEDVFSVTCLYWWGDDGARLVNAARSANDDQHFINCVLMKVRSEFQSLRRRRACRVQEVGIETAESHEVVDDQSPVEARDTAPAIFAFLAETRLGGGPFLCFRYQYVSSSPARLSEQESQFLAGRGIDANAYLKRAWTAIPPSIDELAQSLGYTGRNVVDQHLRRARRHLEIHRESLRARFGDLS